MKGRSNDQTAVPLALILLMNTSAMAAERKPLGEVATDDLTEDTQITPKGAGDDHAALVWWIPKEFWQAILSRDTFSSEADKKATIDAVSGVSILAVVQANISQMGAFHFYSKQEISDMRVTFTPKVVIPSS